MLLMSRAGLAEGAVTAAASWGGGQDDATQSGISSFGSGSLLNQLSHEV